MFNVGLKLKLLIGLVIHWLLRWLSGIRIFILSSLLLSIVSGVISFSISNDATWVIEKLICIIYVCNWLCDWVFDLKIVCWKFAKFFCILYPARLLQWYSLGRFGLKFRLQIYFLNRCNSWPVIKITASDDWGHYTVLRLRRWCVHRRDNNPTTSIPHHTK